jgi:hypothetical protein
LIKNYFAGKSKKLRRENILNNITKNKGSNNENGQDFCPGYRIGLVCQLSFLTSFEFHIVRMMRKLFGMTVVFHNKTKITSLLRIFARVWSRNMIVQRNSIFRQT